MKFTILRDALNAAIQHVSKAVASRSTIPILSGILIEVDSTSVTLTASDQDMSIQSRIELDTETATIGTVERTGRVVLVAKFFVEIVKKLPKDEVHIIVDDKFHATITSGKSEVTLAGLDPEEFPKLPNIGGKDAVTIPSDKLRNMIRATEFAVSTNEGTPILMGVLWNLSDGILKFVATDRHRMATISAAIETDITLSNVVISGLNLRELGKVLPDKGEPVEIVVEDNQVLFRSGNILFFSRIIDGTFPDTSKIVPDTFKTEIVFQTKLFNDAIDRAYLMSREEKTNIVKLVTVERGGDEGVEISSSSSEIGKVLEELPINDFIGEHLKVSFNSKYVLDAIKVLECDELLIGFNGPLSPIIIKPNGRDDALHLVLPYRTTN
jgi:DNA polymerase-3 subunit beta